MKRIVSVFLAASLTLSLTGCKNIDIKKQDLGAGLGALVGGLAGSKIGKGKGRDLAVILGVAGGAWLGGKIGAQLDEQDRLAMSQRSALALDMAKDGQKVNWKSERSSAKATITPKKSVTKTRQVQVVRRKEVMPAINLELVGKPFVSTDRVNVRHMPSSKSGKVVNGLKKGEVITAVGRVKGRKWYMVARGNTTIGYVYAPLLKPASEPQMVAQQKTVREPIDLSKISLDDENMVVDTIAAETTCRALDYEITAADGSQSKESFEACKATDGAWELSS